MKHVFLLSLSLAFLPTAHGREWPADLEKAFKDRCDFVVKNTSRAGRYGNTFFENEKRAYGWAMLSVLGGYEKEGLKFLQEEDNKAKDWNKVTLGIDYYPAFTLKHQIRKYFHFGDKLDADYRKRMKDAAKLFTEKDPYRRPHPSYQKGKEGWTPEARNSWVDIRNTDNLKLMRETSVYLLAEEAGSEEVRLKYKNHLKRFVHGLYHVGMSEWDSENYLGHSLAPLVNLHDFAKDKEVKALATAALDWITVTGALKYRHGIWGGPTKRDYNHPETFGGSAAMLFWLWFGDTMARPVHFESDEIHLITSSYRPPLEALKLVHKKDLTGETLYSCKPGLESWNDYETHKVAFRETHYFGKTYQLGTLWRGTQNPDINGFKLLLDHPQRGADAIVAAPCKDPTKLGSPMYKAGLLAHHSAVGQNRNLAIYLTAPADQPYLFWVPADAKLSQHKDQVLILRSGPNSVAIWPINLSLPKHDKEATAAMHKGKKQPRWTHMQTLSGKRQEDMAYGFVMEVAHTPDEASAKKFADAAVKLAPDLSELKERSAVTMQGTEDQRLRLQWGNTPGAIKVWADGKDSPFNDPAAAFVFQSDVLQQAWHGGELQHLPSKQSWKP